MLIANSVLLLDIFFHRSWDFWPIINHSSTYKLVPPFFIKNETHSSLFSLFYLLIYLKLILVLFKRVFLASFEMFKKSKKILLYVGKLKRLTHHTTNKSLRIRIYTFREIKFVCKFVS